MKLLLILLVYLSGCVCCNHAYKNISVSSDTTGLVTIDTSHVHLLKPGSVTVLHRLSFIIADSIFDRLAWADSNWKWTIEDTTKRLQFLLKRVQYEVENPTMIIFDNSDDTIKCYPGQIIRGCKSMPEENKHFL